MVYAAEQENMIRFLESGFLEDVSPPLLLPNHLFENV